MVGGPADPFGGTDGWGKQSASAGARILGTTIEDPHVFLRPFYFPSQRNCPA